MTKKKIVAFIRALVPLAVFAILLLNLSEIVRYLTQYINIFLAIIAGFVGIYGLLLYDKFSEPGMSLEKEVHEKGNVAYGLVYLGRAIIIAAAISAGFGGF